MNDKTLDYNGFIYTNGGIKSETIQIPETLYKYYSLSEYSIDAFIHKYVYFSHPNQLNDLLDSSQLLLNLKDCDEKYYENFKKALFKIPEFNFNSVLSYEEEKGNLFRNIAEIIYLEHFKKFGILSLTNSPFNNLMMPHYTNERGFILEFDIKNFKKNFKIDSSDYLDIFPVNYVNEIKPINYFQNITRSINKTKCGIYEEINDTIPFLYLLSIKDRCWKYENEWRILLFKNDLGNINSPLDFNSQETKSERKIEYVQDSIKKIILGPLFFNREIFKSEKINKKITYNLRNKIINKKKYIIDFLFQISSSEFKHKVFIQNIEINEDGQRRFCQNLENITFDNYSFSFTLKPSKYYIIESHKQ